MNNQILAHSVTRPADVGTRPFRIVLRLIGGAMPYVVHMETLTPSGEHDGFHNGDYCANQLEAFNAYISRCNRYNLLPLDAMGKPITAASLKRDDSLTPRIDPREEYSEPATL